MKNKIAGHTPGPWKVFEPIARGEDLDVEIYSDEQEYIGAVGIERGINNAMANARLIAAAPDLLAFAEATAHTFGADTMIGKEARAAIAKATVIKHKEQK